MDEQSTYKKLLSWAWWKLTEKMLQAGYGRNWMLRQVEKACYYNDFK